jgi:hypothetical protein
MVHNLTSLSTLGLMLLLVVLASVCCSSAACAAGARGTGNRTKVLEQQVTEAVDTGKGKSPKKTWSPQYHEAFLDHVSSIFYGKDHVSVSGDEAAVMQDKLDDQAKAFQQYLKDLWTNLAVVNGLILAASATMFSSVLQLQVPQTLWDEEAVSYVTKRRKNLSVAKGLAGTRALRDCAWHTRPVHLKKQVKVSTIWRSVLVASMWTASMFASMTAVLTTVVLLGYMLTYPPTPAGMAAFWDDYGSVWAGVPVLNTLISTAIVYVAVCVHSFMFATSSATVWPGIIGLVFLMYGLISIICLVTTAESHSKFHVA